MPEAEEKRLGLMKTDFDIVYNRKGTFCTQWDYIEDRFGEKDLLPFSISDMDFQVPKEVLHAIEKRAEHGIFGYTRWNHEAFKNAVCSWYKKRFEYEPDQKQIVYSPSVIYTIARMIGMLSDRGDKVVTQIPAYDAFYKVIHDNDRELSANPLIRTNHGYEIDFTDLEKRLQDPKAKILLLCNPHNPTGKVWTKDELTKITELCRENKVFIISDEIHMDIVRAGKRTIPILAAAEGYSYVCLCTSASKTFNIPGLIGSYAMIADPQIREEYLISLKNRDGLSSTSIFGMEAMITAYEECGYWVDDLNDYLDKTLEYLGEFFKKSIPQVDFYVPEATYLVWLDCAGLPFSMDQLQNKLVHDYKTAIMRGDIYGDEYGSFLRLNIGCPRSKVEKGMWALKGACNALA